MTTDWMKKELDKILNKPPRDKPPPDWTRDDLAEERRSQLDTLLRNHHPKFFNDKAVAPTIHLDEPLKRTKDPLPFAGRALVAQALEQMNSKVRSSWGTEKSEAERHYAVIRKVYERYSMA